MKSDSPSTNEPELRWRQIKPAAPAIPSPPRPRRVIVAPPVSAAKDLDEGKERPWLRRPNPPLGSRKRWFVVLGLVVAIGATAPALYRTGKHWRALALVRQAVRLEAAHESEKATAKALAAFSLAPEEPETARAMARLSLLTNPIRALAFWEILLAHDGVTERDRLEAARAGLKARRWRFAEAQSALLLTAAPQRIEYLELAAELAIAKNDAVAGLHAAERILHSQPSHENARFLKAQILLRTESAAQQAAARDELLALAKNTSEVGRRALDLLLGEGTMPPEESRRLASALDSVQPRSFEQDLTAAALHVYSEPQLRTELIDAVIADLPANDSAALALGGRWLLQLGEAERVVDLISPEHAAAGEDLFLVRMDALAVLGRWREVRHVLENGSAPIEPLHRAVFLARATRELGEAAESNRHWERALIEARRRKPESLQYVAQYAGKVGEQQVEERAWRELAVVPGWALAANVALVPLLDRRDDTRALRDVLQKICRFVPNDPAPRNDAAYLDLLRYENMPVALATAEQLVRDYPERLAYRTTLALAHLRLGEAQSALNAYDGLQIAWAEMPAGTRAVRAAVLSANGRKVEAAHMMATLDSAVLRAAERSLCISSR